MPVAKTVTVRCAPATAFRVFAADIGGWWPLAKFAINPATDCRFEPYVVMTEPKFAPHRPSRYDMCRRLSPASNVLRQVALSCALLSRIQAISLSSSG